jgi:hypothetical protein
MHLSSATYFVEEYNWLRCIVLGWLIDQWECSFLYSSVSEYPLSSQCGLYCFVVYGNLKREIYDVTWQEFLFSNEDNTQWTTRTEIRAPIECACFPNIFFAHSLSFMVISLEINIFFLFFSVLCSFWARNEHRIYLMWGSIQLYRLKG